MIPLKMKISQRNVKNHTAQKVMKQTLDFEYIDTRGGLDFMTIRI